MPCPRIVIVGNSAAGLAALEAIRRLNAECPVTIVSDESIPAYSRVLLPYLLSGQRTDLSLRPAGYHERMRATALLGRRAVRLHADSVELEDGVRLPFDRLLLAVGSEAMTPDIPGIETPGVFALKTMADALQIRAHLPGVRRAVILGGGLICLLVVGALLELGLDVTIAVSSDRLLARMLDAEGAALVAGRLAQAGVRILTRADVTRVVGTSGRVRSVVTASGDELPAELVILAKGIRPNVELAQTAGLATGRGIVVDHEVRTSGSGIFAAGDCAEAPDLLLPGKRTVAGTWFEAVAQGEIAGASMLGAASPPAAVLKMNVMEILGMPVASIGMVEPRESDARAVAASRNGAYRRLVISRDRIVGAVLIGDVSEAGAIAALIRRGLSLDAHQRFDLSRPIRYADLAIC